MAVLTLLILLGIILSFPVLAIYNLSHRRWKRGLVYLGIWVVLLCAFLPGFFHNRRCGQYTACESNLMSMGNALKMYSADDDGFYPSSLESLVPRYLNTIPLCPSARKNTYSQGYKVSMKKDSYTISCSGSNHSYFTKGHPLNHAPGYPQYDSREGLRTDYENYGRTR